VEQESPDLICITALPPRDLAHARYLCKRLRTHCPQVRILVVRPGLQKDPVIDIHSAIQRLTEAGADKVAVTGTEARTQISQMLFPRQVRSVEPTPTAAPVIEQTEIVGSQS